MKRIFLWLGASLFLAIFFFLPLSRILFLGLGQGELNTLLQPALKIVGPVLGFTFYQALLSTLLTLLVGLPGAYLFSHYDFPGKKWLKALTGVPFMLPTVVVAAGFNALLGQRGLLNVSLMNWFGFINPPIIFINTLGAILIAHVFYNTTIVLRLVGDTWQRLDPRLGQAAQVLGASPWGVFKKVILPLLTPSILAASMLVFLFDFTSFGVILLMGGPHFATLEVEIYIQSLQLLNLPMASFLSIVQLISTLIFSIIYSRMMAKGSIISRQSGNPQRKLQTWGSKLFAWAVLGLFTILFIFPMLALPIRSVLQFDSALGVRASQPIRITLDFYKELFINRSGSIFFIPPIQALMNSIKYALMTVGISLLLSIPVAYSLARPKKLDRILDPLLLLPLGSSAVSLGLGYIITFNQPPLNLLISPWIVPLAHSTIAIPFVIRSLQPAIASIPDEYRMEASVLGASPFKAWLKVTWPFMSRAALASSIFAFTISLGEFGATSLVARPDNPTIPLAIYRFISQPGAVNYGQAMAMATILMIVTTISILLFERIRFPGSKVF
jgi:thiamine transport system permease protein